MTFFCKAIFIALPKTKTHFQCKASFSGYLHLKWNIVTEPKKNSIHSKLEISLNTQLPKLAVVMGTRGSEGEKRRIYTPWNIIQP